MLDQIFFVVVDGLQQFLLCSYVIFWCFLFLQKTCLFIFQNAWIWRRVLYRILMKSPVFFFIVEFQWFLIELSVLPGMILVISDHRLPQAEWARNRIHSSWIAHSAFRMDGFRWLCHRSRHCLPCLPCTNLAMKDHFCGPYFSTRLLISISSSSVQGFFLSIDCSSPDISGSSELSSSQALPFLRGFFLSIVFKLWEQRS